nr:MAG TPA: hypothetical protein [Caudoviricetes sp.]
MSNIPMNGEQAKIIKYSGSGAESFIYSGALFICADGRHSSFLTA